MNDKNNKSPLNCEDDDCTFKYFPQEKEYNIFPLQQKTIKNTNKSNLIIARSHIVQSAIINGFKYFSSEGRQLYESNIKKFLNFYIANYNNSYATQFKEINNFHIIKTYNEFTERDYSKNFILYRILNKKNQFKRIGYTGNSAKGRLNSYFYEIANNNLKPINNFIFDVKNDGLDHFNEFYEYQIIANENTKKKIKNLERLFTIYENYYDNEVGYDLSINNYYNKIIGDLGDFISGEFNGELSYNWKELPPASLEEAVK